MKRVLVTGSSGQLGKTIAQLFKSNKDGLDFTFFNKKELDITNKREVLDVFSAVNYDYCINCAAYTNVEQSEKTPEVAYLINGEGVKNIAEVCKLNNTILIHISTDYVFDGEKQKPYTVTDETNPLNEYGKSKLLGERYIQDILEDYFIIRTSWLYSKEFGSNFYRKILSKARAKEIIKVTDEQLGCPTNTVNLSKYIHELIVVNKKEYGIYHFSDLVIMSWYNFAHKILLENNLLNKIKLEKANNYVTFATRPKYSVLAHE